MRKTKALGPRAFVVEMAGVEPASEERTIKATTYIVLSFTLHLVASDRQDDYKATPSIPLPGSQHVVEDCMSLASIKSTPL